MTDPIKVPDVLQPTAVLCWTQKLDAPHAMTRCDRKAGHGGPHSWETLEWQPMATAPKDGITVILSLNEYNMPSVDFGWHNGECWRNYEGAMLSPLGWMPMPLPLAPPTEPQE